MQERSCGFPPTDRKTVDPLEKALLGILEKRKGLVRAPSSNTPVHPIPAKPETYHHPGKNSKPLDLY
jgi:hypothetical protein